MVVIAGGAREYKNVQKFTIFLPDSIQYKPNITRSK